MTRKQFENRVFVTVVKEDWCFEKRAQNIWIRNLVKKHRIYIRVLKIQFCFTKILEHNKNQQIPISLRGF